MANNLAVPPLPPLNTQNYHVEFRCKVDKWQFILPIIFLCIFDTFIFIGSHSIIYGIYGLMFTNVPFAIFILVFKYNFDHIVYIIDGNLLHLSSSFRTSTINISSIKKIRRGRFWVASGHNYSASYIKLRIVYDTYNYLYVSPKNEKLFVETLQAINPNIEFSSERNLTGTI